MIFGLFPSMVGCQSSDIELTIIHTNDSHSHLGNVARMATVISEIREEAGAENTLLLDAGDVCGGTVYYSLYRGERISICMDDCHAIYYCRSLYPSAWQA
jgi:2',3'-cyclic-nucleotide 2'-phosphodiesterase (5'-nucleotidase family)